MDAPKLNTDLLEQALKQFEKSLEEYRLQPDTRAYRDSVVIHFVIVYNLMVQAIFRYVRAESMKQKHADDLSLSRAIRRGLDLGIIRCEWEQFVRYGKARNTVAHIYDEAKADELIALAPELREDAAFLLAKLKERVRES